MTSEQRPGFRPSASQSQDLATTTHIDQSRLNQSTYLGPQLPSLPQNMNIPSANQGSILQQPVDTLIPQQIPQANKMNHHPLPLPGHHYQTGDVQLSNFTAATPQQHQAYTSSAYSQVHQRQGPTNKNNATSSSAPAGSHTNAYAANAYPQASHLGKPPIHPSSASYYQQQQQHNTQQQVQSMHQKLRISIPQTGALQDDASHPTATTTAHAADAQKTAATHAASLTPSLVSPANPSEQVLQAMSYLKRTQAKLEECKAARRTLEDRIEEDDLPTAQVQLLLHDANQRVTAAQVEYHAAKLAVKAAKFTDQRWSLSPPPHHPGFRVPTSRIWQCMNEDLLDVRSAIFIHPSLIFCCIIM